MDGNNSKDAVVVGAGPNGLACAITLARAGLSVTVIEKADTAGGGARSLELTLPGFIHDVCSAVHPLALASPFFRELPLSEFGLKWIIPEVQAAHPLEDGTAAVLKKSVDETADGLGEDRDAYRSFFTPLVLGFDQLAPEILGPLVHLPRHLGLLSRFGVNALLPATTFAKKKFKTGAARSLFMGVAAHSAAPLTAWGSSAVGLILQLAGHAAAWPLPEGGSQALTNSLVKYLQSLGGEVLTGREIKTWNDIPRARAVFFDLTPSQIVRIAANKLSSGVMKSLSRFEYGAGVFKLDWALTSPIPWINPDCRSAPTVHLGGSWSEIAASEGLVNQGKIPEKPYVLLTQPTLFDGTRAPRGSHIAWAYCHVPNGSTADMTAAIENQIESVAPGFKRIVMKRHKMFPADLESRNPNLVGGDISGGRVSLRQLLFRPSASVDPYRLGENVWICSSSSPPGPGVHGMCGHHAAMSALKHFKVPLKK